MANALIGHTGFVGGNLLRQNQFDFLYNSKNIQDIDEKNFDMVVCAGVPAIKWLANKEPEKDWANIEKLINNLKTISAKKFVLISTIDVYPVTTAVTEDFSIDTNQLLPYGKHRRMLEEFVANNFDSLIVRLPGIFGIGLKKNPLFDLIKHDFTYIHPKNMLQFYNLDHIWKDIKKSLKNNLKIINFVTEPISLDNIAKKTLNLDLPQSTHPPTQQYDVKTKFASLWGNAVEYLYTKDVVLEDIKKFVKNFAG